jgi:site-specific DNA-methyltransferase (adenine-specific)
MGVTTASFLGGKVDLHCGNCLAVLPTLAENSIDSCCTDPPYHLTSIVRRFGGENAAPAQFGKDGAYSRASAGFMGKQWDGGDIAFRPELWREVYRVLKPGAHLLAFGGTRTYHRMACAIEDAGFEIRDTIMWLYGSGFPKSHDVSKGIDKNSHAHKIRWFGEWLRKERAKRGISQKQLAEAGGFYDNVNHGGLVANWELRYGLPSAAEFNKVCDILDLNFERIEQVEREIIGQRKVNAGVAFTSDGPTELDITTPATDAARQWEGWGTALKPACEPIVLARKPLSEGTVAANVLKWGTGALNIDGCRVGTDVALGRLNHKTSKFIDSANGSRETHDRTIFVNNSEGKGRWPANVIHDGSEEVTAGFPDSVARPADDAVNGKGSGSGEFIQSGVYGAGRLSAARTGYRDAEQSAARFFYTAKADSDDRLGSKHPTVKPLDLMQYLVRLVTPKVGTCLDPFSGTGTTGEAAFREGMKAVLIEREAEYQDDIRRRMGLVLSGPDERAREAIKQKIKDKPVDAGPLFGGSEVAKNPLGKLPPGRGIGPTGLRDD